MNHSLVRASIATAALMSVALPSLAQSAPAPDWTVTGNAGLFTDYRFRGISQTNKKPAFQGGFDVGHKSGLYVGNWNSNVDSATYTGSSLEMDFYGGYKGAVGDFSYDVGVLYYYYPGSSDPKIDNTEVYISGGWGPISLKYSYAVSDFFGATDSKGSYYLDGTLTYPLNKELSLVGHLGYQGLKGGAKVSGMHSTGPHDSITDWKLGVTYELAGWQLGASYVDTNRDLTFGTGAKSNRNLSDATLVVSVGKSF